MGGKAKPTIKAARNAVARNTRDSKKTEAKKQQGALADRHTRQHTPDRLYSSGETQE